MSLAALNAYPLVLGWLGLLTLGFFAAGIYVVSGRWAAGRPKRDAKAIARWDALRAKGFRHFAFRNTALPVWLLFFSGRALLVSWREAQSLRLPLNQWIELGALAVGAALITAMIAWRSIRHAAEEAHDRAARLQDQQTL
jgi:hypothetical protein